MTTLATNKPRTWEIGADHDVPVTGSDIIFEGAAVGDNGSGYARPLVAGDPFRGFAVEKADNSAGSAGDKDVKVRRRGTVVLAISGLAITDVGKDVFASDDDTFTLTQGSNTRVGYVARWVATGSGVVAFDAEAGRQAELTDSSGGSANDTIEAMPVVGGSGLTAAQEAAVNNNFADIAAAVNTITRRLGG